MITKNSLMMLLMVYHTLIEYFDCKKEDITTDIQREKINEAIEKRFGNPTIEEELDFLMKLLQKYLRKLE